MTRQERAPRLAVLVSGHGFGHLVRTSAVLTALGARRPVRLVVVTAAPSSLWPRALGPHTERWLATACDVGVVQRDDLQVDVDATRDALKRWEQEASFVRERIVSALAADGGIDCILGDVPPMAFEIASTLGVPSIALANFSWDWIYREMGFADAAESARRAYAQATLLLELTPAGPLDAFPRRSAIGVVGRRASADFGRVRRALGLLPDERCVLLALRSPLLERITLPSPEPGIRYLGPTGWACSRSDCVALSREVDFVDAFSVADAVLAKAGYGILGDCATNDIPLVWVRRKGFPEDSVLAAWLERCERAREVAIDALETGGWRSALADLWSRPGTKRSDPDAADLAAIEIARLLD